MCPFSPMLNKNSSPISQLENSTQVGEQGQCSTNNPDPRQNLILEALPQQRPGSRLRRWLGQLCNDRCLYLVLFADVLGMQDIKRRRKVLVGQVPKLDRN